ncbi:hypothetical protein L7F22_058301 [Adiantum nelumboides]|nr:hypothetical protein [Adiantum nelumboides]
MDRSGAEAAIKSDSTGGSLDGGGTTAGGFFRHGGAGQCVHRGTLIHVGSTQACSLLFIPSHAAALRTLNLSYNNFNGTMPASIGRLTSLTNGLNVSHNAVSGPIPTQLASLQMLLLIDLSDNVFSGSIPDLSGCVTLQTLSLSKNDLSGPIPSSLGGLGNLVSLNVSHNSLQGTIPAELGNLTLLQSLDLSFNKLSGNIPLSIAELTRLTSFNVSYNSLLGSIPDSKGFRNLTSSSFFGIPGLCGDIIQRSCPKMHRALSKTAIALIIAGVAIFIIVVSVFAALCWKPLDTPGIHLPDILEKNQLRLTAIELERATNGFNEKNVISHGGFSIVYKAKLKDGKNVAVKVFKNHESAAFRSAAPKAFLSELHTLGQLRHRNLTRILGYCSNLDIKAMIMELMHGGNLDKRLHDLSNREMNALTGSNDWT